MNPGAVLVLWLMLGFTCWFAWRNSDALFRVWWEVAPAAQEIRKRQALEEIARQGRGG